MYNCTNCLFITTPERSLGIVNSDKQCSLLMRAKFKLQKTRADKMHDWIPLLVREISMNIMSTMPAYVFIRLYATGNKRRVYMVLFPIMQGWATREVIIQVCYMPLRSEKNCIPNRILLLKKTTKRREWQFIFSWKWCRIWYKNYL